MTVDMPLNKEIETKPCTSNTIVDGRNPSTSIMNTPDL